MEKQPKCLSFYMKPAMPGTILCDPFHRFSTVYFLEKNDIDVDSFVVDSWSLLFTITLCLQWQWNNRHH